MPGTGKMGDFLKPPSGDELFKASHRLRSDGPLDFQDKDLYMLNRRQRDYSKQFNSLYYYRLRTLKKRLTEKCRRKWENQTVNDMKPQFVDKVLDVEDGKPCWIIGTIYSQLKYKTNVLKEVADTTYGAPPPPPEAYSDPENDQIMIEDESGRVILAGKLLEKVILVSGNVVGLLGAEVLPGIFEVLDVCFPEAAAQKPLPLPQELNNKKVAFVSGLGINASGYKSSQLELLNAFLIGELFEDVASSISRLIIAGNSISVNTLGHNLTASNVSEKQKYKGLDKSNFDQVAMKTLDNFLRETLLSVPVTIMPGESDPSEISYPQLPLHKSFFPTNRDLLQTTHFTRATNPSWMEIDGTRILGTSGENITDIYKYLLPLEKVMKADKSKNEELKEPGELVTLCPEDSRMPILESCLLCQNIVPTAPDTLWCYPYQNEDPFILDETPHVFFAGNQPKFESKLVQVEDKKVRLITIPRFDLTGEIVLMDTTTLECEVIKLVTDDSL